MGIAERRDREKRRRIEEIIAAAKRAFQAKGFAETTMNDIADSSELSRRTVYSYFKSKEELSLSVALMGLRSLIETVERTLREDGSALERIARLFDHYADAFVDDPGSFRFLVSFGQGALNAGPGNEVAVACLAALDRLHAAVAELFDQGAADGSMRAFPDPRAAAKEALLLISSAMESSVASGEVMVRVLRTDPEAFLRGVFRMLSVYLSAPAA